MGVGEGSRGSETFENVLLLVIRLRADHLFSLNAQGRWHVLYLETMNQTMIAKV